MPHSGCHFLRFWRILVPKLSILGHPWRPAGHQMTPKIAQVAPKSFKKSIRRCSQEPFWRRPASRIPFGELLGTILVDFGRISNEFWWILASFLKDCGYFSEAAFAKCQRRLARNEITENVKNMQRSAEICNSQTQPKTHKSKLQSKICKLQNAISCNKRQSTK